MMISADTVIYNTVEIIQLAQVPHISFVFACCPVRGLCSFLLASSDVRTDRDAFCGSGIWH